jgi:predicted small lipoprotein YifL
MRITAVRIGFFVALTLASASCGQKGPLFLPDEESTVVEPPAPAAESPSEETKKKEEPR